jgi:hypothetical protein
MTYWEKKDGIYKETLESQKGDILYAADTYTEDGTPQTEISDWHEPRYEVRENRFYRPDDTDDNVLYKSRNWDEVVMFLSRKVND